MMRSVLVLFAAAALAGCNLYFGSDDSSGDPSSTFDAGHIYVPDGFIDAYIPPSQAVIAHARCEDGTIRHVFFDQEPLWGTPGHGAGVVVGSCIAGCRSAVSRCASPTNCTQADADVCGAPPATGPTSTLQGQACADTDSLVTYTTMNQCGQVFPGGTCVCNANTYQCSPSTDTADVHTELVGKWHGTVTTTFLPPYQISLWIYPDGTYWAECASTGCSAPFYYDNNGPLPWRRIKVLATTDALGATADIGLYFANDRAITSMFAMPTTLRFRIYPADNGCTEPFEVNLTRD